MSSRELEKILNEAVNVDEFDVEFSEKHDLYTVDIKFFSLNTNEDMNDLLKLNNKLRAALNRAYKIEINFSVRL